MTFGVWIRNQPTSNERARALQDFADAQSVGSWPYHSERLSEYAKAIEQHSPAEQRDGLIDALGASYASWLEDEQRHSPGIIHGIRELVRRRPGAALLVTFGLVVAIFLVWGIFSGDFMSDMARPEAARGLITFLFAFTTIAIITLVAIATFWLPSEELELRFSYAKDLITIIIGVLGTIIGFYFGSINDGDGVTPDGGLQEERQELPDAVD